MIAAKPLHSPRLYLGSPLARGAEVSLDKEHARYLTAVLRLREGAAVRVFNGYDGEWVGRMADAGRRLDIAEQLRPQIEESDTWLLFAPLRRDATEMVVQKATELGAAALLPVQTVRTQPVRLNLARLAAIAREAAEQSERLSLPRIEPPQTLASVLVAWDESRPLQVAVERLAAAPPVRTGDRNALLIGPEGGFTATELEELNGRRFVRPVSLGPSVLRAETAAIAGLALLQIARAP